MSEYLYYKVDGRRAKVRADKQAEFESKYPDAKIYYNYQGRDAAVPISGVEEFKQKYGADNVSYSVFDDFGTSASNTESNVPSIRDERQARREERQNDGKTTLGETLGKSAAAAGVRTGKLALDLARAAWNTGVVGGAINFMTGKKFDEKLQDEDNRITQWSTKLGETADRLSREADPTGGEKGYVDLIKEGNIGQVAQKALASGIESLPMMLAAGTPWGMLLYGAGMAAGEYSDETRENPDIPSWKRAINSMGSAALEMAVEKIGGPLNDLGKAGKEITEDMAKEILETAVKEGSDHIAKRIVKKLGTMVKQGAEEGVEEVVTSFGNDVLGTSLDLIDGDADYGIQAQWNQLKEQNPDASLADFAKEKGKEYMDAFIGGAVSGLEISTTTEGLGAGVNALRNNESRNIMQHAREIGSSMSYDDLYDTDSDVANAKTAVANSFADKDGNPTISNEFIESLSAEDAYALAGRDDFSYQQRKAFGELAIAKAKSDALNGRLDTMRDERVATIRSRMEKASENGQIVTGMVDGRVVYVRGGKVNNREVSVDKHGGHGPLLVIDSVTGEEKVVNSKDITSASVLNADETINGMVNFILNNEASDRQTARTTMSKRAKIAAVNEFIGKRMMINSENGIIEVEVTASPQSGKVLIKGKKGDLGGQAIKPMDADVFYDSIYRNENGEPIFVEKGEGETEEVEVPETPTAPETPVVAGVAEDDDFRDFTGTILVDGAPLNVSVISQDGPSDTIVYEYEDENGNTRRASTTIGAFKTAVQQGAEYAPEAPVVSETPVAETPVAEEVPPTEETPTEEEAPVGEVELGPDDIDWDALFDSDPEAYFVELQKQFGDGAIDMLTAVVEATQEELDGLNKNKGKTQKEIFANVTKKKALQDKIDILNGMIERLTATPAPETAPDVVPDSVAEPMPEPAPETAPVVETPAPAPVEEPAPVAETPKFETPEGGFIMEDGYIVNPIVIEMPGVEGESNKIYLAEHNGKWGVAQYAVMDNGNSSGSEKNGRVQKEVITYDTPEEAIVKALKYFDFYRKSFGKKQLTSAKIDAFMQWIKDTYLKDSGLDVPEVFVPVAPNPVDDPIKEAKKREKSLATQLKRIGIPHEQKQDMAFNAGKAVADFFATREEYEDYAEDATDFGEYNADFERGVDFSFANRPQNPDDTPGKSVPLENEPKGGENGGEKDAPKGDGTVRPADGGTGGGATNGGSQAGDKGNPKAIPSQGKGGSEGGKESGKVKHQYPARKGNVTGKILVDTFGLAAVDIPNSRKEILNTFYDFMMEMAKTLGISPKSIGNGGWLTLGNLRANARAFAGHTVLYKTFGGDIVEQHLLLKYSRVSSIAHEWWHALDHALSFFEKGKNKGPTTEIATGAFDGRQETLEAVRAIMKAIRDSGYTSRIQSHPLYTREFKNYVLEPTESAARAFAEYMRNKFAENGITIAGVDEFYDDTQPTAEEMRLITPAIENLFKVLQEKEGKKPGTSILYHIGEMMDEQSDAKKLATESVLDVLKESGIDVEKVTDEQVAQMLAIRDELSSVEWMTVYHGSPQKFDEFDHTHMGEGEGAQAHGWGTYVAKSSDTAKAYAQMGRVTYTGPKQDYGSYEYEVIEDIVSIMNRGNSFEEAIRLGRRYWNNKWEPSHRPKRAFLETLTPEDFKLRNLYDVEIPEDNGENYFYEANPSKAQVQKLYDACVANGLEYAYVIEGETLLDSRPVGKKITSNLRKMLGSDKAASEFLAKAGFVGIKYDGRRDGECFVIFNEADAKITGRTEFYQTPNGTVYGWTDGKKIYLTNAGINPNTPVHEYTHLWAKAMMQKNPKGWQSIKDLLRGTPVWNEVLNDPNYSSIHADEDLVASEVLSRISGTQNAARLEQMAQQMIDEAKGTARKLEARGLIQNIKDALNMFWNWVGTELFGIEKFESVEQVTDRVLWDLMNKTDLGELSEGKNEYSIIRGEEGKALANAVNQKNLIFKSGQPLDYIEVGNRIYLYENPNYNNFTAYSNGEINVIFALEIDAYRDLKEIQELVDIIYGNSQAPDGIEPFIEEIWSRHSSSKNDMHDASQEQGGIGGNDSVYARQSELNADNGEGITSSQPVTGRDEAQNAAVDFLVGEPRLRAIENAVNEEASKLGVKVTYKTREQMPEGHKNDKGYYDTKTGEIVICTENASSIADAIQTILHEAVAHKGLRQLMGDKFNEFINRVYESLDAETKAKVDALAEEHYNGNKAVAMEEYMATLAETTDFADNSVWGKIKSIFEDIINAILGRNDIKIGDNELRYILRASYNNMVNHRNMETVRGWAQDQMMREEYKINEATPDILSRTGIDPDEVARETAKSVYERIVNENWQEFQRQFQDAMQPVRIAIDAIQQETGNLPIEDYENFLLMFNQASSRSRVEIDEFSRRYYSPIIESINEIVNSIIEARGGNTSNKKERAYAYQEIMNYLIAKHGLERNKYYQSTKTRKLTEAEKAKAVSKAQNAYDDAVDAINAMELTDDERADKLAKAQEQFNAELEDIETREVPDMRDYSGLTSLFGFPPKKFKEAEEEAQRLVDDFEKMLGRVDDESGETVTPSEQIEKLWKNINAATSKTLRHSYESGMLSRQQYNDIKDMFKFYIPLRGFDETTAEDVYSYARFEGNRFNPAVHKAKGRTSVADDPIATIMNMAESEIAQGNKNRAKQALYNFLLNRAAGKAEQNSLMQVERVWYLVKKDALDNEYYEIAVPNRDAGETYEEFEERMKVLEAEEKAVKSKKGKLNIGMRFQKPANINAHYVFLKVNGVEKAIYINGDPKAAQAINGEHKKQRGALAEKMGILNRFISSMFTNYSLEFTARNYFRDMFYSHINIDVKESDPAYRKKFRQNWRHNNLRSMVNMLKAYRAGEYEGRDLNEDEKAFVEFMRNGGQTGYTLINSVETHKKDLERAIANMQKGIEKGGVKDSTIFKFTLGSIELLNEASELVTRFAAFKTSRDMGRGINTSIADAKEVTVNFNTKGAQDGKGFMGMIAHYFGWSKYFFNASVQGVQNLKSMAEANKLKFGSVIGGMIATGFLMPVITSAIASLFGNDDEEYWNIPEYERQNNFCIPIGNGKYVKVPLPIGFREVYAIGDMVAAAAFNKKFTRDLSQVGTDIANKLASIILPINPLESTANGLSVWHTIAYAAAPSSAQFLIQNLTNTDWKGAPLQKEYTYNEDDPQWMKAFASNPDWMKGLSKWCNEHINLDGDYEGMDWSPEKLDNTLSNVFGGIYSLVKKTGKSISMIWNEENRNLSNIPLSGVVLGSGIDNDDRFVTDAYYDMKEYYDSNVNYIKRMAKRFGYDLEDVFEKEKGKHHPKMNEIYSNENFDFMQEWYTGVKELDAINDKIKKLDKKIAAKETPTEQDMLKWSRLNDKYLTERRDFVNDMLELD